MPEPDDYAAFVIALESRPPGISPLSWLASVPNRPAWWSAHMLRWLREKRDA